MTMIGYTDRNALTCGYTDQGVRTYFARARTCAHTCTQPMGKVAESVYRCTAPSFIPTEVAA